MSKTRTSDIAHLEDFIFQMKTEQREAMIARARPEDQEAIRQAMQGGSGGSVAVVEEEKIAPPPPAPANSQEAIEKLDAAARNKQAKEQEQVFRAEVAGRVAERKRTEAAITATERFAEKAFNIGNGVFHGTRGFLESKPTPGGIGVPLAILLFFFFLLLPVNGHTRLMWLWLTITGNAQIGGPLTPPTLTPQGAPVSATTPNNIVTAVTDIGTFLQGLFGGPPQTTTTPAGTTVTNSATGSYGHRGIGAHNLNNSTVTNEQQNRLRVKGVGQPQQQQQQQNNQTVSNQRQNQLRVKGVGGGPDHLSNLNGHARSYGDLLRSMED